MVDLLRFFGLRPMRPLQRTAMSCGVRVRFRAAWNAVQTLECVRLDGMDIRKRPLNGNDMKVDAIEGITHCTTSVLSSEELKCGDLHQT